MRLVLFRHGLAVDRAEFLKAKGDDALRPLVPKGRERTIEMAQVLKEWQPDFDLIVTSPFLRSQQTAKILSKELKISNLFECAEMAPSAPVTAFAQWLQVHADDSRAVLAVGHEPQLSTFACWCLSGQRESFIDLKKSGMLALELESFAHIKPGTAQLSWHISPKLL